MKELYIRDAKINWPPGINSEKTKENAFLLHV